MFVSVLLSVWFVLWLYFTWQAHKMETIRTNIMIDLINGFDEAEEECEAT